MRTVLSAVLIACWLAPELACAAEWAEFPRHEVWLGIGGGTSLEQDIFNVPDDLASEPEMLIGLGYLFNLDASDAVGFHVYGSTEILPDILLFPPGAPAPVPISFEFDTYNIGLRVRHTFTRMKFAPYAWVGASLAQGTLSNAETGDLEYSGYSVGVGPGVLIQLSRHVSLSVEGMASFGMAKWKTGPFANSSSREIDPGLLGVIANVSFGWGRAP